MARELDSQEIYNKLKKQNIINAKGQINFSLGGVSVTLNSTDTVGNTIQSWLKEWFISNDIYFSEPKNSQAFPDFYLSEDKQKGLLEIKAFNYNATPAFDIANFESYCDSVMKNPFRLNADYLIFGYTMTDGVVEIKDIWLKKIWEISGTSERFPLRVQVKRDMIYNIRPKKWYSTRLTPSFKTKENFLFAIYETLKKYEHSKINEEQWLAELKDNYAIEFDKDLDF